MRVSGVVVVAAADVVLLLAALVWAYMSLTTVHGVLHFLSPWVSVPRLACLYLASIFPVPGLVAGLAASLALMADLVPPEWALRRVAATLGRRLMLVRCITTLLLLLPSPLAFKWYEVQVEAAARHGLLLELHQYPYSASGRAHLHRLQYQLQCCGADSLEDWYNVTQAQAQYAFLLRAGSVGTMPLSSEVPFSCCRRYMLRPCTTRDQRQRIGRLLWHERPTVNTLGCVRRLHLEAAAHQRNGWMLLLWGLVQMTAVCLPLRLFTTSMHAAAWQSYRQRQDNLTQPAAGWLVSKELLWQRKTPECWDDSPSPAPPRPAPPRLHSMA